MKDFILHTLSEIKNGYSFCGIVDRKGRIYPLGSDTKVISTLFEIVARQAVAKYADGAGMQLVEPSKQNHYPDFTLMRGENDTRKVAIDVKTTYLENGKTRFRYTLGGYTSYIRPETEDKNIVYPYSQYSEHWVIGFVYKRLELKREASGRIFSFKTINEIPVPLEDVDVFMQEKWRISGDKAGSGNTTNIGSITGTISDFTSGNGVFLSEDEFVNYWRGYGRTAHERKGVYSNVDEFRNRGIS